MTIKKGYNNSKLYYLHGYQSSPNSTKGLLFREKLNAIAINYRDCKPEELVISDCLKQIENLINKDKNVTLIGSSFGGYLAAKTALQNPNVKQIILLNPAIIPPSVDISKFQGVPQKILSDMQDSGLFDKKINSEIFILIGANDDVIPSEWTIEFAKAQGVDVKFLDDDHSFTHNINKLPFIISEFLGIDTKNINQ
jgi:predicted esterase YcpF (UPF0227 family)